jgi:hypothetical protein
MFLPAGAAFRRYDPKDTNGRLFQPGVRQEGLLFQLFRSREKGVARTKCASIDACRARAAGTLFMPLPMSLPMANLPKVRPFCRCRALNCIVLRMTAVTTGVLNCWIIQIDHENVELITLKKNQNKNMYLLINTVT